MAALTMGRIRHRVAVAYGIDPAVILSERRSRAAARPRQVAIWLCHILLSHSLPRIGRSFHRDHTTVMAAIAKVEALRAANRAFADFTDALRDDLAAEAEPTEDDAGRAAAALVGAFEAAVKAAVRRDPDAALAMFRRWTRELTVPGEAR